MMVPDNSYAIPSDLLEQIRKEGYIKTSVLNAGSVNKLYDAIMEEMKGEKFSFYNSGQNIQLKRKEYFYQLISNYFQPVIEQHFPDYCISRIAVVLKGLGKDSGCDLHTDDNSFDEKDVFPLNIWTPLLPTNALNGLEVIPQSHLYVSPVRGFGIPQYFSGCKDTLLSYSLSITTHLGESIIYHPGLLHYSKPNQTNQIRPAVVIGLAPRHKQQLVYWGEKDWLGLKIYTMKMSLDDYILWDEKSLVKDRIIDSKRFRRYRIDRNSYNHFIAKKTQN